MLLKGYDATLVGGDATPNNGIDKPDHAWVETNIGGKIYIVNFNFVIPFGLLIVLYFVYNLFVIDGIVSNLSPPSFRHWFGTDLTGNDVFIQSINALGFEVLTLLIVPSIYSLIDGLNERLVSFFKKIRG